MVSRCLLSTNKKNICQNFARRRLKNEALAGKWFIVIIPKGEKLLFEIQIQYFPSSDTDDEGRNKQCPLSWDRTTMKTAHQRTIP